MGREGIQIYDIGLSARHPTWTPRNVDGSDLARGGTGVPAANGWQHFAIGTSPYRTDPTNYLEFKSDSGLKVAMSGYNTAFPTEDRKGDGDSVAQNRFTGMEVPGARTMSLLIPRLYEGIWRRCLPHVIKLDHPHGTAGRGERSICARFTTPSRSAAW